MTKLPDRHALTLRLLPDVYQKLCFITQSTGLTINKIVNQLIINVQVDAANAEEIEQKNVQLKDLQDQVKALKTQNIKFIIKEK